MARREGRGALGGGRLRRAPRGASVGRVGAARAVPAGGVRLALAGGGRAARSGRLARAPAAALHCHSSRRAVRHRALRLQRGARDADALVDAHAEARARPARAAAAAPAHELRAPLPAAPKASLIRHRLLCFSASDSLRLMCSRRACFLQIPAVPEGARAVRLRAASAQSQHHPGTVSLDFTCLLVVAVLSQANSVSVSCVLPLRSAHLIGFACASFGLALCAQLCNVARGVNVGEKQPVLRNLSELRAHLERHSDAAAGLPFVPAAAAATATSLVGGTL